MRFFKFAFYMVFILLIFTFINNKKKIEKASSQDLYVEYTFINAWGSKGSENGQFNSLTYIKSDQSNQIYVSDFRNNSIQKFDSNGNFITKWGEGGDGEGEFKGPAGMDISKEKKIYIADYGNSRIQVFDSNGNFITKWGKNGFDDGDFINPLAISISPENIIYVIDAYRIQKFTLDGEFIGIFNFPSPDPYIDPYGEVYFRQMTIDKLGYLYIIQSKNYSSDPSSITIMIDPLKMKSASAIYKFAPNDTFIEEWHTCTNDEEHFGGLSITTDTEQNIFIADANKNHIKKLTSEGELITKWGSEGDGNGEFNKPMGITVDFNNNVYVIDSGNYRIQKFAPTSKLKKLDNEGE